MKKLMLQPVLCAVLLFAGFAVNAQEKNKKDTAKAGALPLSKLFLTATSLGDSIILRWAPEDPIDWKLAGTQGYILERTTLGADNKVEVRFEKLTTTPIKPWSKEEFLQNVSKTNPGDKYTAIVAQALYGESFTPANQNNREQPNEFKMLMKQHNEDAMRHSFALLAADVNVKAATALGLRYADKNIDKNKKYIYRLYAIPRQGLLQMDTALYIISPKDVFPLKRVTFVTATSHNNVVFLQWPKNGRENGYTGFYVERSNDGGNTFDLINADPFTNVNGSAEQANNTVLTFADTVPQLYKKYMYRVRGVNSFAQLSPYSLTATIMPRDDKSPPAPTIQKSVKISSTAYKILWQDNNSTPDIKGYYVNRSKRIDSNFIRLNKVAIPATARSYVDSSARPGQSYYYTVTISDTAGNTSTSVPDYVFTSDTIPPSAPVGLAGNIDTNGVVTIHWRLGAEEDIQGYRIYKANAADHEFTVVSKALVMDTTFRDTIPLKTLTKEIFYKIVAVDDNLNNSKYSAAARLVKPDIVPPVAAVFTNYITSDTTIQLFWNASTSSDLNKQYLYRKATAGDWQQIAVLNKTQAAYTDAGMQRQQLYSYRIVSEDSAGLQSEPSFAINAKTYYRAAENGGGKITAILQPDSAAIKVEWVFAKNTSPVNIILYRAVNDGSMTMYENVAGAQTSYIDKRVSTGNTYKYSFKCIYQGNSESTLSKEAVVIMNK